MASLQLHISQEHTRCSINVAHSSSMSSEACLASFPSLPKTLTLFYFLQGLGIKNYSCLLGYYLSRPTWHVGIDSILFSTVFQAASGA